MIYSNWKTYANDFANDISQPHWIPNLADWLSENLAILTKTTFKLVLDFLWKVHTAAQHIIFFLQYLQHALEYSCTLWNSTTIPSWNGHMGRREGRWIGSNHVKGTMQQGHSLGASFREITVKQPTWGEILILIWIYLGKNIHYSKNRPFLHSSGNLLLTT